MASLVLVACAATHLHTCRGGGALRQRTTENLLKFRPRQPIVAQGRDGLAAGANLLFIGAQQVEHAQLHRVVLLLRLTHDLTA
mgnify:CR=1 FL=1